MRVCHVIGGLSVGGAERMLIKVLEDHAARGIEQHVVCFNGGPLTADVARAKIPLSVGWSSIREANRADLICSWMYKANAAASLLSKPIVWNIRHSVGDISKEPRGSRLSIRAGRYLSSRPRRIIYNSAASENQHKKIGYRAQGVVIPNGFDTDRFHPSPEIYSRLRAELGFDQDTIIIGHVGRLHPQKNHDGLISALARLTGAKLGFVLVGPGVDQSTPLLTDAIEKGGIGDRVRLLGSRSDVENIIPAFDILVLPSVYGESFPNVIGEAMACGVPCVATDLGDCAAIIGDTGLVVNVGAAADFVSALTSLLCAPNKKQMGERARRRVIDTYRQSDIGARYHSLFTEVLGA